MSNKAKWGYLAGMIDGEGFITVTKGSTPAKNGNGYMTSAPRYNLIISVTGTNETLMKWLVDNFGGTWSRDKTRQNPKWKTRCSWRCVCQKNKELLILGLLPYLVIKREQAILGLEVTRMAGQNNPIRREEIHQKMKALNRRGEPVETNTPNIAEEPVRSMGWRWKPTYVDPVLAMMIEPELIGDNESVPTVM